MITIGFTGDVMIGRLVEEVMSFSEPEHIWGDVLPLMRSVDVNIINLEAALTHCDEAVPKIFNFKAEPERVEILKLGCVHIANLANNHCLDYTEKGLTETLDVLDQAGIKHIGAGKNESEAQAPLIYTKEEIKIGILGYTDNEPSWRARPGIPGTNYIEISEKSLNKVINDIRKLRSQVDFLIVTMHWGPNMRQRPSARFQSFARQLIDCGVDIFHGHSAHIYQGIEIRNKKIIFYDTGDFIDDYYVDPYLRNDRSFYFLVEIYKNKLVKLRLIPIQIGRCQVNLAKGGDREESMDRMIALSQEFGTKLTKEKGLLVAEIL